MSPPQHIQWYSSAIEAYIYLPMVFTALPLLHFGLLKTKRLSNQVVQLAGFSLAVGLPLMYPCSDYFLHMVGAAASMVIMSLRMLEIGTIERSENSRWSLLDYTEFLMTSDNKRLRQLNELMHLK
ncbi:hypothetical protein BDR26DRAFT_916876 [Obelidium mucronatum]|nr:hypothetical protein BDR26DRAFT_916876 [Obelidium mucronatum]